MTMAVYPDTLNPERLTDREGIELWRRTIQVGEGSVVILGAYHQLESPGQEPETEASVTVTSFCCPKGMPVSSVVIFNKLGQEAVEQVRQMEKTLAFQA
jgi:hypothetical protein